jgi:periplasmic divalent cation tolerance protein
MSTNICIVYSTFSSTEQAEKIAKILLEKKLIACANILPASKSIYMWQSKLEEAFEIIAIFKTTEDLYSKVEAEIKANHSYQTPCVLKIAVEDGSKEFLNWIEDCTK